MGNRLRETSQRSRGTENFHGRSHQNVVITENTDEYDDGFILQEFLKKEFSHENIYFWSACERYRVLTSVGERRLAANEILARHLSPGASDPVNVDSHACSAAHDGLEAAEPGLFEPAQRQIYNLMKFDSFSRFLKSDLYRESLEAEAGGRPLPLDTDQDAAATAAAVAKPGLSTKSKKTDGQPRRRSMLPSWNHFRTSSNTRYENYIHRKAGHVPTKKEIIIH